MNILSEKVLQDSILHKLKLNDWNIIEDVEHIRNAETEVIIISKFRDSLRRINNGITDGQIDFIINDVKNISSGTSFSENKKFQKMILNGITIEDKKNDRKNPTFKIIDLENVNNNSYDVIEEFKIIEGEHNRRIDILLFVNGLPLVVFELKNPTNTKTNIDDAFNQLKTYQRELSTLFKYNAFNVVADGHVIKFGSITANFDRYQLWNRNQEGQLISKDSLGNEKLDYFIDGLLNRETLLDVIMNFTIHTSDDKKIISAYHQYHGMKKAIISLVNATDNKGGIIWHTQGSGKSLSMVFLTREIVKNMKNPTVVVITDRVDLDSQLFQTFSKSTDFLLQTPKKITSRTGLSKELGNVKAGGIYFTTVQKFNDEIKELSNRENIVVLVDEAHRSHDITKERYVVDDKTRDYSKKESWAQYVNKAFPNAKLIGFTGTPINNKDRQNKLTFGSVIDTYDMKQAVLDGSTVPIKYDTILVKMKLKESKLQDIKDYEEELAKLYDQDLIDEAKKEASSLSSVIGDSDRLIQIAKKFSEHYISRKDVLYGKAMFVAYNRNIAFKMYNILKNEYPELYKKTKLIMTGNSRQDSEEMTNAIGTKEQQTSWINEFKTIDSDVDIIIVVDMLLTGFDLPILDVMYIDKPLRMHNLMQAIARVNRRYEGKQSGLIVDFIGLGKYLKDAINQYTTTTSDEPTIEYVSQVEDKLKDLLELIRKMFSNFDYSGFENGTSEDKFYIINKALGYINTADKGLSEEKDKVWSRFKKIATEIYEGYKYVRYSISKELVWEFDFVLGLLAFGKKALYAPSINPATFETIKKNIKELIESSIISKEIVTIDKIENNSEVDLLDDEYISKLKADYAPETLVEIIKAWLEREIKEYAKTDKIYSADLLERLMALIDNYNKIQNADDMLIELAAFGKKMQEYPSKAKELGLSIEEMAFYHVVQKPEEARSKYDNETLIKIAKDLLEKVGENQKVDWYKKESVKRKMRMEIILLLREYDYPPENITKEVTEMIIEQSESFVLNKTSNK